MQDDAFITCLRCGKSNSSLVSHCYYCGNRLERICSHCGHDNPPEAKYYCEKCKQPLSGSQKEESIESHDPEQDSRQPLHGAIAETTPDSSQTATERDVGVCPRCNHSNQPGSSFCSNCGLRLPGGHGRGIPSNIGAFKLGTPGGFWVRVGAAIVDYFVVSFVSIILFVLFGVAIPDYFGEGILDYIDPDSPNAPLEQLNDVNWTLVAVDWIFYIAYAPILISLWGTTVGKRPFDLYVVKADGERCSFWRALGRELAKFISCSLLFIGYLMIAFREDKRGLHDLIAGTAVIKRSE